MSIELVFTAKKKKVGNSTMVLIPKPFAELLKNDEEYKFKISEKVEVQN